MKSLIDHTITFVKKTLKNAESGHDWFHIERVYRISMKIAENEPNTDRTVIALSALLHDIADAKFHKGDETVGPEKARKFLKSHAVSESILDHVIKIIENISFRGGNTQRNFNSKELQIVQDADRLDALGAIGIARTFNYGGYKNRRIYDPDIPPQMDMSPEAYKNSNGPTINHFYEKLLLLKDQMNTETGKNMAENRHRFMVAFLAEFFLEWDGKK